MTTTLTLKFKGVEAKALDDMIKAGLFNSKSEAIRAALVKYSTDMGLISREKLWEEIGRYPRRGVSERQLSKDLEEIGNEV